MPVSWIPDANGTIGYFKFIYNGGEVVLSITGEAYDASFQFVAILGNIGHRSDM